MVLALDAVGECQGTEAVEEEPGEGGGVPWKKWNALQMLLLYRHPLDVPLEETEVKVES